MKFHVAATTVLCACQGARAFVPVSSSFFVRRGTASSPAQSRVSDSSTGLTGLHMVSQAEKPAKIDSMKLPKTDVAPPEVKRVYLLDEGNKDMKMTLGGKGANLCEMAKLGLPVPPAFIISTETCLEFFQEGADGLPKKLDYEEALAALEADTGKTFGDPANPLLVSVRSGAPASMPGMMDTVLNLGLNDEIVEGIIESTGNERFAYDTYRRFLNMYSDVVMGMDKEPFEEVITSLKKDKGVTLDVELDANDWKQVVEEFKKINPNVPSDPRHQLAGAVTAVFASWYNNRAIRYRSYNGIPDSWGTAVTVQAMAYGNMNDDCGTGVAFSRNPSTGENKFFGGE